MLKLAGKDAHGEDTHLFFDNKTFSFYLAEHDTCSIIQKNNFKTKTMQAIIPLGYGCNNNCVYCIQKGIKDPVFNPWKVTSSIISHAGKVTSIHFLGGEPLKRFDVIQHIVRLFPNMKFSIVTNGLYLTKEITRFLLDNKFSVAISHDGDNHNISRGENILASSKCQFVKDLANNTNTQIASILINGTESLYDRYMFFYNLNLPFSYIDINTVLPYTNSLNRLVLGVDDRIKYMSDTICDIDDINQLDTTHTCGDHELIYKMYNLAHTEVKYDNTKSACPIFNDDIITIGIDGNEIYCYNKLENPTADITEQLLSSIDKTRCTNCPVLLTCMSGCHISGDQFDHICNRSFYRKIAYFQHFVKQLLGFDIHYIEGDIYHGSNNRFDIKPQV